MVQKSGSPDYSGSRFFYEQFILQVFMKQEYSTIEVNLLNDWVLLLNALSKDE